MNSIILKKLTLKNFKGIKNLSIDFSTLTNIYADNGKGKTTINDSFTWLLFAKDSLDRSAFEIKTLDKNGEVIHGLEHEVCGILDIDGISKNFKKVFKEKWTKKRGESEQQLTGHETLHYIDEVPVKESEYKEAVNKIINEQLFKLITNPLYFSMNMKWQDRRTVLLNIIGDITSDRIVNYNKELVPLLAILENKDVDLLKKTIAAQKKRLNDDIRSIPFRVDELNNSIKVYDFEALEIQRRELQNRIKSIEEQLIDNSKGGDEILKEKELLFTLKSKLKDLENIQKVEAEKPLKIICDELRKINYDLSSKESEISSKAKNIDRLNLNIKKYEDIAANLRKKWSEIDSKQFEFDEKLGICQTCKRPFETDDIEKTKNTHLENFNKDKAHKLANISQDGKSTISLINELNEELKEIDIDQLKQCIEKLKEDKKALEYKQFNFEPVNIETDEIKSLKEQIQQLEIKLQQPILTNNFEELKLEKNRLSNEIENINKQLTAKENNEEIKKRIETLLQDEKALAQQIAALEGQEILCEKYIKTKVELLETGINNKFKYVSFKLFKTQVNGAIDECCEALIDGVPFSNANSASQVNGGLDIINTLCNHYGVNAPIFIDKREGVNKIIDCTSQIINLIVSKHNEITIEREEI